MTNSNHTNTNTNRQHTYNTCPGALGKRKVRAHTHACQPLHLTCMPIYDVILTCMQRTVYTRAMFTYLYTVLGIHSHTLQVLFWLCCELNCASA